MAEVRLPAQRRPRPDHLVHVHADDGSLVDVVAQYLTPVLLAGDAAVVVATPVHRAQFAAAVTAAGVDLACCRRRGQYVELDAEAALASFSPTGTIDPAQFALRIGGRIAEVAALFPRVHVYGEMVARLWGRGDAAAALDLEHLWNDLATRQSFRLLCAYPARTVHSIGSIGQLGEMLRAHTSATG